MSLAALMIGGRPKDPDWVAIAAQMLTVDSLIHNMLGRTGVLAAFGADHRYGPGCYGANGCEAVIYEVTEALSGDTTSPRDATSPSLQPIMSIVASPTTGSPAPLTPIEIQKALWRFCTAAVLDHCNAARVGRGPGCHHATRCPVAQHCAKATATDSRDPFQPPRGSTP